jgi:hypothetical protein
MKKIITVMAMVIALALSALAPALANGKTLERGNWLSDVAEPVELQSTDITFHTINGVDYVRVQHNIGAFETLVQREPARYRQNVVTGPGDFDVAWLGIVDSDGTPVDHKGQLNWYYEVDDDQWVSLTFQFNGKGELLHLNGVSPE